MPVISSCFHILYLAAVVLATNAVTRAELLQIKDLVLPQYPRIFSELRGEFDVTLRAVVDSNFEVARVEWMGGKSLRSEHAQVLENSGLRAEILSTIKKWRIGIPESENSDLRSESTPIIVNLRYRLIDDRDRGNCHASEVCTAEYSIMQGSENITITIRALVLIHVN